MLFRSSENTSHTFDDASTVLDESGSLGPFLNATIAKAKNIANTKTPDKENLSDDLDDAYVELSDDIVDEIQSMKDNDAVMRLIESRAVRYKLSPDAKFSTSPINIRDKDYDFSLDLSYISIVENEPFCGTENESAVKHMNELSSLSSLFSDDEIGRASCRERV